MQLGSLLVADDQLLAGCEKLGSQLQALVLQAQFGLLGLAQGLKLVAGVIVEKRQRNADPEYDLVAPQILCA